MLQVTGKIMLGLALALVGALVLAGPAALAGGWAVITLDHLPEQVVAGEPLTIGFVVRQHGRTPLAGLAPLVTAVQPDTGQSVTMTAEPQGDSGHYVATLVFPQPGVWRWSIQAFSMEQPLPPLPVSEAALVEEQPGTPFSVPLVIGAVGLIGVAGSSLLWWRTRTGWALALIPLALVIGGAGFASAANQAQTAAPQETAGLTQAERGEALFVAKGCLVCHQHSRVEVTPNIFIGSGPDLTHLSATPDYLHQWLKEPASLKPKTDMPNLYLKEHEIEALIAFLTAGAAS